MWRGGEAMLERDIERIIRENSIVEEGYKLVVTENRFPDFIYAITQHIKKNYELRKRY